MEENKFCGYSVERKKGKKMYNLGILSPNPPKCYLPD